LISKKRARTGERIERRERKLFHCGVLYVYRGGRGGGTWKQQILMIIHTSCRSGQSKIQSRKPQCAHASVPKERTWSTREQVISSFYMFQCPPKKGVQVATTARVHTRTNIRPHALNQSISHLSRLLSPGCDRRWRWPGICFWSDCAIWNAISSEISIATWTGTWIETWSEIWTWTWNAS